MNETSTQPLAEPWSRVDRIADGPATPADSPAAAPSRSASGKFWGLAGLAVLTGVTSLVVATISIWLTPVYMAAMVLIFVAPRSSRPAASPQTDLECLDAPPDAVAAASPEAIAGETAGDPGPEGPSGSNEPAEPAAEAAPSKPRKRRAKGKKAKAALAEASSSEPTWIRVGPGKFVRADLQAAPADVEKPSGPPHPAEAGSPAETENPTGAETDPGAPTEATAPAPVAFEDADRAVGPETCEEETPADADEEGMCERSPAPSDADEAAPTDPDEEYGIAPSALAETWEPEALPEALSDDEPEPAPGTPEPEWSAEAGAWDDYGAQIGFEAEAEGPTEADEGSDAEMTTEFAGPSMAVAPTAPGRPASGPAPEATPIGPTARASSVGVIRRPSRLRERTARTRPPRNRGASPRTARSGRTAGVRVEETAGRGRRRSDRPHRRPHPRSPPHRA